MEKKEVDAEWAANASPFLAKRDTWQGAVDRLWAKFGK